MRMLCCYAACVCVCVFVQSAVAQFLCCGIISTYDLQARELEALDEPRSGLSTLIDLTPCYTAQMRCLAIDLSGPLNSGGGGEKGAMTAIDMFSYWLRVTPVRTNAVVQVSETLHLHVFCDIGGLSS